MIDSIIRKVKLGVKGVLGFIYKYAVNSRILKVPSLGDKPTTDVIVSMTSYGRRVYTNVVYYTLVSVLRQNLHPKQIILWLSNDEWSDETIPLKLKKLKCKGIEINYFEDIKSYKKIIPTLIKNPTRTIVTLDDDVIYSKDTISSMVEAQKAMPGSIICLHAAKPIIKNGVPVDYEHWNDLKGPLDGRLIFPIGEGGILYPPQCLENEVINKNVFIELCPLADDVWLWISGLRKGTSKCLITKKGIDLSYDKLYQFFHKKSTLSYQNRLMGGNDIQVLNLLDFYKIKIHTDGTIESLPNSAQFVC